MNCSKRKTLQEENGYVTDTLLTYESCVKAFSFQTSLYLVLLLSLAIDNTKSKQYVVNILKVNTLKSSSSLLITA